MLEFFTRWNFRISSDAMSFRITPGVFLKRFFFIIWSWFYLYCIIEFSSSHIMQKQETWLPGLGFISFIYVCDCSLPKVREMFFSSKMCYSLGTAESELYSHFYYEFFIYSRLRCMSWMYLLIKVHVSSWVDVTCIICTRICSYSKWFLYWKEQREAKIILFVNRHARVFLKCQVFSISWLLFQLSPGSCIRITHKVYFFSKSFILDMALLFRIISHV